MAVLGILNTEKNIFEPLAEQFNKQKMTCQIINKETDMPTIDGLLIPISKKEEIASKLKWMLTFQERSGSFIWFFSEEPLNNEREMLLELGVNDVLTTEDGIPCLISIIRNTFSCLDRRVQLENKSKDTLKINDREQTITICDALVQLTEKEWQLFSYLHDHINQVVTYEEINEYLWPNSKINSNMNAANIIHSLRHKIQTDHSFKLVTLRKKGYQLFEV